MKYLTVMEEQVVVQPFGYTGQTDLHMGQVTHSQIVNGQDLDIRVKIEILTGNAQQLSTHCQPPSYKTFDSLSLH